MSREEENSSSQSLSKNLEDAGIITFDWGGRWLKGPQYSHILENIDSYCQKFGFEKYSFKCHPDEIYQQPRSMLYFYGDGMIYFVRGRGVGGDFGFPRVEKRKKYRWKKMNFTTNLPKKHPHVTYVVASAMKAHFIDENDGAQFRMHAVIPYCHGNNSSQNVQYILCHVREVDKKKQPQKDKGLEDCFVQQQVDLYKLFSYLHNFNSKSLNT